MIKYLEFQLAYNHISNHIAFFRVFPIFINVQYILLPIFYNVQTELKIFPYTTVNSLIFFFLTFFVLSSLVRPTLIMTTILDSLGFVIYSNLISFLLFSIPFLKLSNYISFKILLSNFLSSSLNLITIS
jgi:hypothetical protein